MVLCYVCNGDITDLSGQGHASAGDQAILCPGGHHAELASLDERDEVLDLLLQCRLLLVLLLVRVRVLNIGV